MAAALAVVALAACGSRQTPITELSADELWVRGIDAFNAEDWDEAIRYLDRYVLAGGADPRVYQARYYLGQARFEEEEYVTAAAEFTRLASDLGRNDLADDARYMACRAYNQLSPDPALDQEYTRAAIQHCTALAEIFPDSEFADEATEIVEGLWHKLAEKVYEGGEWYMRRGAYDSAIIYFEDVVEQYPDTEFAPRALGQLIEIYETLQYEEEREEVRERLLREYPESEVATRWQNAK